MSIKHRLKGLARSAFARVVWHSGAHRLFDRSSDRRLLILYGHCVDQPETNGSLDADMKIGAAKLEGILRALGKRYELVTVAEGGAKLEESGDGRSMVALTMDDGYRDNLHDLVPVLARSGARATVFLEGGAVAERRLPWLHALGWLQRKLGPEAAAERLAEALPGVAAELRGAAGSVNRQKRILKYDADPSGRNEALVGLVEAEGGDPLGIVDELYLSYDEARELARVSAVEIGGHTSNHPVLSRLKPDAQLAEIAGGRVSIEAVLGQSSAKQQTFAYPYGRRWDFDDHSAKAVAGAGYRYAVTTHAGVNRRGTDLYRMRRWPIHGGTKLHEVAVEACGAFEWLRGLGVDLVE